MSKLVTFEQAEKLKYLGFTRNCLFYYEYNNEEEIEEASFSDNEARVFVHDLYENFNDSNYTCSAPTVSEALDFIRGEKGIECGAYPSIQTIDNGLNKVLHFHYRAYDLTAFCWYKIPIKIKESITTQSEAESELLNAVLEYLEK